LNSSTAPPTGSQLGLLVVLLVVAFTACGRGPFLTATPNPVDRGRAPGETTIAWSTGDGRAGQIYVSSDGAAETLFAEGASGVQRVPWIMSGSRYVFTLYAMPGRTPLATCVVTQRTDTGVALTAAMACGVVLLAGFLAGGAARRWALEIGPLALLVAGLWVKSVWLASEVSGAEVPVDRFTLGAPLAALLLPFSLLLFVSWNRRAWLSLSLSTIGTIILITDTLHFRFYRDVASIAELAHARQLAMVLPSVLMLVEPRDLWHLVDLVAVGALLPILSARHVARPSTRLVAPVLFLAGTAVGWPGVRHALDDPEGVFEIVGSRRAVVSRVGILPYHYLDGLTIARYAWRGRLLVTEEGRELAVQALNARRWASGPPTPLRGAARGRSVIVLMVESLQAFPVTLRLAGQPVMPRLAAFAEESVFFGNFMDQTHVGTTSDGEFTALQSLHPAATGAVATRYAANDFRALPGILRDHGYRTVSMTADPGHVWNKLQMHPRLGFSQSFFSEHLDQSESFGMGISDGSFLRQAAARLKALDRPFMTFLSTVSTHAPFTHLPERFRRLDPGSLSGTTLGAYLQAVNYFDRVFGDFVDDLRSTGLLDEAVVVVYGDHHAFLSNPPALHRLLGQDPASRYHHWKTERTLPLLIRLPHASHAGRVSTPAGHLDVAPTLLGLLGIDDGLVMLGRDLTRRVDRPVVFRRSSVVTETHTLVDADEDSDSTGCYENGTGAAIDCEHLEDVREAVQEELQLSDRIISGNLVPALSARLSRLDVPGDRLVQRSLDGLTVIAHRGNASVAPENTLEAIEKAFEAGAGMVEIDLRLSRDGVPIAFHDDTLGRTTDGEGAVSLLSLAELKKLDAGSWMGPAFAGARIPTLAEAVGVARRYGGRLLLDLKVNGLGRGIADTIRAEGFAAADVAIGTWTPDQAADMARHLPDALILASDGWRGAPETWNDAYFTDARARGIDGFELGTNWSPRFVAAAHAHRMPVYAFAINDDNTMRRLIQIGIDGIETDRPARLVEIVSELRAARAGQP
jgi:phosphoglycerol transferase MdoB-like AlkP superfamily enzyme/glycerophosphoryl diester phosphodiesterase